MEERCNKKEQYMNISNQCVMRCMPPMCPINTHCMRPMMQPQMPKYVPFNCPMMSNMMTYSCMQPMMNHFTKCPMMMHQMMYPMNNQAQMQNMPNNMGCMSGTMRASDYLDEEEDMPFVTMREVKLEDVQE